MSNLRGSGMRHVVGEQIGRAQAQCQGDAVPGCPRRGLLQTHPDRVLLREVLCAERCRRQHRRGGTLDIFEPFNLLTKLITDRVIFLKLLRESSNLTMFSPPRTRTWRRGTQRYPGCSASRGYLRSGSSPWQSGTKGGARP